MEDQYNYYLGNYESIKSICSPLKSCLNISHFGYLRIYKNSNYIHLTNDKDLTYEYMLKISKSNIFFSRFLYENKNDKYSFILWPKTPIDPSMELYLKHSYWHGLTIANFENSDDYIELFWFATDKDNEGIYDLYFKHSSLLLCFVKNFDKKIISQLSFKHSNMSFYNEGFTFNVPTIDDFKQSKVKLTEFIQAMYPKGIEANSKSGIVRLTEREIECLSMLSECKTMKEISRDLEISPRTVETHLQALQIKTGYAKKSDMVKLFNDQIKPLIF